MKIKATSILQAALLFAVLAILFGCQPVHGEGTTDPTPVVTQTGGITFTQVMSVMVAVVLAARLIVKLTPTPADDSALEKIVEFLKHVGLKLDCLLVFAGLALCTGCGSIVQVKEGADPIVVHAEWLAENSTGAIDSFLAYERTHEAELLKRDPGIHKVADQLRDEAEANIVYLRTVTKQYKADRSTDNGDKVKAATNVMLAVVNQVRSYQGLSPLTLPIITPSVSDLMKTAPTNGPPAL